MYKLILHKKVIKFINKRESKDKEKIDNKLRVLKSNPYPIN